MSIYCRNRNCRDGGFADLLMAGFVDIQAVANAYRTHVVQNAGTAPVGQIITDDGVQFQFSPMPTECIPLNPDFTFQFSPSDFSDPISIQLSPENIRKYFFNVTSASDRGYAAALFNKQAKQYITALWHAVTSGPHPEL